jgi:N6-L-threonylcarbamoyladenine synthase
MSHTFPAGRVLGIESSCDETGVALVHAHDGRCDLLAQALHSQVDMHQAYGGVVPELASRDHITRLVPLIRGVLATSGCNIGDIDVVAYTRGPGLAGALLVGAGLACALGYAIDRPVLGVHHLEGHLLSPFLAAVPPRFPFVALLVSGGHTQLMHVRGVGHYELLGETIDDAAGEAFDKTAKMLGLGYPGGPALARLAEHGDPGGFDLPRPLMRGGSLDFSFAGLKTAVWTQLQRLGDAPCEQARIDLAASTQAAIVDVLVAKCLRALDRCGETRLVVSGGVGANQRLRGQLDRACAARGAQVHYPDLQFCTDNGAMIALAAAMRLGAGQAQATRDYAFDVKPRWDLESV